MKTLTHNDIINILKSLKVGPQGEAPIKMFCIIVKTYQISKVNKDELNIFKKYVPMCKLFTMFLSCYMHEDGTIDYYCQENLKRIEDIAKKYNGIINLG